MAQDFIPNIYGRVREKKERYQRYNFERLQEEAFATFFDLAQEYTTIENLYQISVAVPKEFFGLESRLYVLDPKTSQLEKVCTSHECLVTREDRFLFNIYLSEEPYETEESCVFPIHGNLALTHWVPFHEQSRILGMFEIYPKEKIDAKSRFFFEKFTNRIGYNLHQKLLVQQNVEHIKFINHLVSDINHNVISPNLYYKLFLIRLKKILNTYCEEQERLRAVILGLQEDNEALAQELSEIYRAFSANSDTLEEERNALSKHYEHTSLFLETLLRREHFVKGTYVLKKQPCNFRTEIIGPLLDRYIPIFHKKGIAVDNQLKDTSEEELTLFVDKGLISQVFDNFFSNAAKYTHEVKDRLGNEVNLFSCNRRILRDYFGKGVDGVRFDIYTTGKPLSQDEAAKVFEEGFRAPSAGGESGTGHGLHFVRTVVEIHGGQVGCEPQKCGNLFYFILPVQKPVLVNK